MLWFFGQTRAIQALNRLDEVIPSLHSDSDGSFHFHLHPNHASYDVPFHFHDSPRPDYYDPFRFHFLHFHSLLHGHCCRLACL